MKTTISVAVALLLWAVLVISPVHAQEADPGTDDATTPTQVESTEAANASDADAKDGDEAGASKLQTLIQQGGVIVYILIALSLIGIGFVLERLVNLTRGNISPRALLTKGNDLWNAGQFDELESLAKGNKSALGQIMYYCVEHRHFASSQLNETAGEIASRAIRKHRQNAYWLAVVFTIAPLLGLLGTVIGMIESFEVIAVAGDIGDTSMVAGGIAKALITTAAGLLVAVPAMAFFHFFKMRTNSLSMILEEDASEMIKEWFIKPEQAATAGGAA